MIARVEYDKLPSIIRSIVPRDRISHARWATTEKIILTLTYCYERDVWVKIDGKWEYRNPGK